MGKRVLLGVQKEKKTIKHSKKRFLKKVVDYLKSDSYMYAPLLSNPPPASAAPKIITSPTTGCILGDFQSSSSIRKKKIAHKGMFGLANVSQR